MDSNPSTPKRPAFRTMGLPKRADSRRLGWFVSIVMHVLVLLLLLTPRFFESVRADEPSPGAGGPGPAGGGGGGTGGTGGARESASLQERLQYIRVAPQPEPTEPPPVEVEEEPVVPPPVPEPVPEPELPPPTVTQVSRTLEVPLPSAVTIGVGGGTGNDGTAGTGPGSGGGVGSGIGTGRGSGVGPGTGGGDGDIYPPTPNHFFIPPLPAPDRVKGFELVARFEVDEQGRAKLLGFNPTPDRDYNRKLREALERLRWRPAVRTDGTPVKHTANIYYSF